MEVRSARGVHSVSNGFLLTTEKKNSQHAQGSWSVDCPLGPSVVRWTGPLSGKSRALCSVLHTLDSAVCCIRRSPCGTMVATCTDGGRIQLWSHDWSAEIAAGVCSEPALKHIAWAADSQWLAVIAAGIKEYSPSVITLWKCTQSPGGKVLLNRVGAVQGNYYRCEWIPLPSLSAYSGTPGSTPSASPLEQKDSIGCPHALVCMQNDPTAVVILTADGNDIKRIDGDGSGLWPSGHAFSPNRDFLALCTRGRQIILLRCEDLAVTVRFTAQGKGAITCLAWVDNHIVIPAGSQYLVYTRGGDCVGSFRGPTGPYEMEFCGRLMAIAHPDGISFIDLATTLSPQWLGTNTMCQAKSAGIRMVSRHKLACCGCSVSPDGNFAVSGDLGGQLIVWSTSTSRPVARASVRSSVRALSWGCHGVILVGCMNGSIYGWNALSDVKPGHLARCQHAVNSLKWANGSSTTFAAVTTGGHLNVFKMTSSSTQASRVLHILAHAPVQSTDAEYRKQFGSIHLRADVWSVAWSPDNRFLATASEDQSTVVWSASGDKVKVLRGHTSAVTCVDWKVMATPQGRQNVLATCADDRSVMLWNTDSWEKKRTLATGNVSGWYTITYLCLEEQGSRILCGTENGYVVAWNITSGQQLFCRRLHGGSIEGLALTCLAGSVDEEKESQRVEQEHPQRAILASCAADCNVVLCDLNVTPSSSIS